MGLIKVLKESVSTVMADQWREYFYCDSLSAEVLCIRGQKRVSKGNNNGSDNIISNGSVISVADGQCMLIVEQGKVVDICAEPGEFTYDSSTEPSLLYGGLNGANIKGVFSTIGKRFTFGGETAKDQRVYYINTKELIGNKYGTPNPVPFRVVDERAGIDMDITIKCFGEYSYQITNPLLFYTKLCANVSTSYKRSDLDGQLKSEFLTALQPAFAKISAMGVRYSELPGHTLEIAKAMNEVLSDQWRDLRGIEVVMVGVSSVKADEEDEKTIKEMQREAAYKDPTQAAAALVNARRQAMQDAAKNTGGAAMAFMGMNMADSHAAGDIQSLYAAGAQQQAAAPAKAATWTCKCGAAATGKFCPECGAPKPADASGWTCKCGVVNKGKFCSECGAPKPVDAPKYKCDKCGWEPEDPTNPPKFCPECGDPFDENDAQA